MKRKFKLGSASILIIFMLGMIGILIGVSLVKTGYFESIMGRSINDSAKAYFAANSGIEDAVRKISIDPLTLGGYSFDIDDSHVEIEVIAVDEYQKTIKSIGTYGKYSKKIIASVLNTSISPDFDEAVFGGFGGVYLDNNTLISNMVLGEDGNVFSRSFIKGRKKDNQDGTCKNSASAVYGNATAVGSIEKWSNSDKGVCITKNAYAKNLENCFIAGNAQWVDSPSPNCEIQGTSTHFTDVPEDKDFPNIGVDAIISYLASKDKYLGNCEIGGVSSLDCSGGTGILGNIVITGNLTIKQNSSLVVKGPILVEGNINIESNSDLSLIDNTTSRMIIARGKILSSSNVSYFTLGNAFLILVSTDNNGGSLSCDSGKAAIEISSNDQSVLFFATRGCILISANQNFQGAIYGEAIELGVGSSVKYDPKLADIIFNLSEGGGWQLVSFKEY